MGLRGEELHQQEMPQKISLVVGETTKLGII